MSAIDATRPRFATRLIRSIGAAAGLLPPVPALVGAAGTAAGEGLVLRRAPSGTRRAEMIFRRQAAQHGRVLRVLEIGHRGLSHADWLDEGARHEQRDVTQDGLATDILGALRDLPDGAFDAVVSVDAIEHLKAPWRVADEITRILAPGGITFHTTVFSTRYQTSPDDYFRFTPDGLKSLFERLECVTAEFDATERHRGERPRSRRDAGDIFGGSREGWRVHFCGRKPVLPR